MTGRSEAANQLVSIRRYMLSRFAGVVLLTILAFAVAAYALLVRPAQDELARLEMELAADRVESVLQLQTFQAEQVLRALRDHTAPARARLRGSTELGHAAMAEMRNRPPILAIAFARDDGVGIFVNRTPDGYRVRELDARGGARRQHWLGFDPAGRRRGAAQEIERDFDARERPWFKGALATAEGQVFITEPFLFFESKLAGITFAIAERDRTGGATWVVAANVSLQAMSAITSGLQVGRSGGIAILAGDGKLIGLPRDPAGKSLDVSHLLQEPAAAGLGFIAQAWERRRADAPDRSAHSFRAEGRTWLVRLRPLELGNLKLVTATFAPRDDFAIGSASDLAAVLALMAGAFLVSLHFAHRFSRRVGDVVQSLVAESERIGALQLDQPVKIDSRISEIATLVTAQERMRTLLLAATRELKERVKELTALHSAARLLQTDQPIDQALLERFAALLPQAVQFPDACEARIHYGDLVAATPRWRETPWTLSAGFTASDGRRGAIEVTYLEWRPGASERPFLTEERVLIASLADMLSAAFERRHALIALEASNRELEDRVAARTAELAEREALTRTLYESSPAGLSLATPEGRLRHISPRWTDILGYTLEEAVAMNTQDFWADPAERNGFVDALRKHGYVRNFECRFHRKSGEVFSALMNASFVEVGGERLIASWAHDITELKAAEQALADALRRQEAIFGASPHGIAVFQRRHCIIASPSFERLFGYPRGGMIGQSSRALFMSQEEFERAGHDQPAAAARGDIFAYENRMARKDGSSFWCRVTAAPLAGAGPEQSVLGIYEDISERKQAEEALVAANAEMDAIFRSASLGIVLTRDQRVRRYNRRVEGMFGYGEGELVGQHARTLFGRPDEDYEANAAAARERLARGEAYRVEKQLMRKDGSQFWCRIAGRAIDAAAGSLGTVWMLEDVSDEHAAAEALREAKRIAEEATQAKSMFLASMSHEIRTPMNGVTGMLQLLGFTRLDPEQKATLDGARDSARSLLRIIDDLLDFSKIEAGKLEIRPEVASIAGIVDSVRQVYAGVASAKDLAFGATVDPDISPALKVDPLRLRQILNNFVSNAIKFTEKGGVEIAAALLERTEGCDRVRFSVTDTGIGIDAQAQAQLFQPFVQATADTARRFGGTGLGLNICRRLTDLMGGAISMQSTPGKGTTMMLTLTLPIADARELPRTDASGDEAAVLVASRRRAPDAETARSEGTLVLVVEDHPTNRTLATRLLNLLGYAAETAQDGREALEKWASARYGAILTDCNMPKMDGFELAQCIRARESGGRSRIPIIACTANALAGEAERCIGSGMDDFVAKPIELDTLARAMQRWLPLPGAAGSLAPRLAGPGDGVRTGPDGAPVEPSSLAAASGGNPALLREILADFRSANDADMGVLRHALAERDIAAVARASHRIKGACKMVGALALANVCERMEKAGRANRWQDIAIEQAALEHEFERLSAWLSAN